MKADVKKYVEECDICQQNKFEATKPARVATHSHSREDIGRLDNGFYRRTTLSWRYNVIMVNHCFLPVCTIGSIK